MDKPLINKKPERIETLDERIKRAKNRADQALTVAIIALLLTGGAYALSLAYGISWGNLIQNNAIFANNQNQLLRSEIYDALMNVSSGYSVTIIQNGTFEWSTIPAATTLMSNYTLKHVQIGPLGFDVLVLNPPPTPLSVSAGGSGFSLGNFIPRVDQVILFTQSYDLSITQLNHNLIRLTDQNTRKMYMANGCLQNTNYGQILTGPPTPPACYVTGVLEDASPLWGINALGIRIPNPTSAPLGNNFFYQAEIVFVGPPSPTTFTLTSPWELVLPAS